MIDNGTQMGSEGAGANVRRNKPRNTRNTRKQTKKRKVSAPALVDPQSGPLPGITKAAPMVIHS